MFGFLLLLLLVHLAFAYFLFTRGKSLEYAAPPRKSISRIIRKEQEEERQKVLSAAHAQAEDWESIPLASPGEGSPPLLADISAFLARAHAQHGSLVRVKLGADTEALSVANVQLVEAIAKEDCTCELYAEPFHCAAFTDGVEARAFRRMLQNAYSQKTLAGSFEFFRLQLEEVCESWKEAAAGGDEVVVERDLSLACFSIALHVLGGSVQGINVRKARDAFESLCQDARERSMGLAPTSAHALAGWVDYMRDVLLNIYENSQDANSLACVLRSKSNPATQQPFTKDEAVGLLWILLKNSYRPIAHAIAWCLQELARNAPLQDRVAKEAHGKVTMDNVGKMRFAMHVMKEALRLHPSFGYCVRKLNAPVTLARKRIPEDTILFVSVAAMHTDEENFSDPASFDPSRFENSQCAFLAYGSGVRDCPGGGVRMSLLVTRMALAMILSRYELEAPADVNEARDIRVRIAKRQRKAVAPTPVLEESANDGGDGIGGGDEPGTALDSTGEVLSEVSADE
eukprot:TRINITY_DN5437_c1_g1_i1.p1 TRINITY_DN5437_c1_g1~~TRINITY_DN5437_c1_g1_i1.p1  ORF type:complete len:514 (+),score=119.85 TRINITY_DN5437_c1_g1_i1:269-1810(+)